VSCGGGDSDAAGRGERLRAVAGGSSKVATAKWQQQSGNSKVAAGEWQLQRHSSKVASAEWQQEDVR